MLAMACNFTWIRIAKKMSWPGKADLRSMLGDLAFIHWRLDMQIEADLATVKLATLQRMDRSDADEFARMCKHWKLVLQELPYRNLESLEALRLSEAAIGIKRYQLQNGAWPNTLTECVPQFLPAIPGDPNQRGRFIQYEPSPPRVFSIGKALTYTPEQHGFPDENYFQGYALTIKECESGNRILFLAN